MISFVVEGEPVPQPRPRVTTRGGFGRAYVPTSHPVHRYRRAVADAAKAAGVVVTEGAVSVAVTCIMSRPKSHRTKSGIRKGAPPLPRSDVDNHAKAVLDALTCVAWHDDAQVAELHVRKIYGDVGKTEVVIRELPARV